MTPDDRERLADIRTRLHGVIMQAGDLDDQGIFRMLEERIDLIITWLRALSNTQYTKKR
jgi:hypothetical protein